MPELTFSQPERRNFAVPALLALAVLGIAAALLYFFTPHRIADVTVTHDAILSKQTVMKSGSQLVGSQDETQDYLFVVATVRIDDKLKLPIFIKDITATLTAPDDTITTASAVEKNDLDTWYQNFADLKALAGPPLLRETAIQPNDHAEGIVLIDFPVTQAAWDQRKSATITIDLYYQGPLTVTFPKP